MTEKIQTDERRAIAERKAKPLKKRGNEPDPIRINNENGLEIQKRKHYKVKGKILWGESEVDQIACWGPGGRKKRRHPCMGQRPENWGKKGRNFGGHFGRGGKYIRV